jgi:hypothetical protein
VKITETPAGEDVPALEAGQDALDPITITETPQPKDFDGVYLKAAPYCNRCHKVTPGIYGNRCGDCGERKAIIPGVTT